MLMKIITEIWKMLWKRRAYYQQLKRLLEEQTTPAPSIDHIYVSEPMNICKFGVLHMGISNHHLVYAVLGKIKCGTNCHVTITFCSFRNWDEDQFRKDFYAVEWNEIKKISDVNQMWENFITKVFNVIDQHLYIF